MTTLPDRYWDGPHDCSLTRHLQCSQSEKLARNQAGVTREETRPATVRLCWTCKQPATHTLTREGSIPLDACDNCTRIDRAEAERRGWTVARLGRPVTLTKTAVTLYDIESNRVWRTMSVADGEHEVQLCYGLGDVVQEYDTTDRDGNPCRVILQIDAPMEYRDPDQGGVYVFTR